MAKLIIKKLLGSNIFFYIIHFFNVKKMLIGILIDSIKSNTCEQY